jgi:hypothetical protein
MDEMSYYDGGIKSHLISPDYFLHRPPTSVPGWRNLAHSGDLVSRMPKPKTLVAAAQLSKRPAKEHLTTCRENDQQLATSITTE